LGSNAFSHGLINFENFTIQHFAMSRILFRITAVVMMVGATLFYNSCQKEGRPELSGAVKNYQHLVPWSWNELFLVIERYADGYRPGPAPRALAYMGLSAFEACQPGMSDEYNSIAGLYPGLSIPPVDPGVEYHWPTVVNGSYAYLMKRFFPHVAPDLKFRINQLESQFDETTLNRISRAVFERSKKRGEDVARAIFEWSATDPVGHNAFLNPRPSNYVPPIGAGLWAPTYPDYSRGLFPYWGTSRTFAITQADKLSNPPLPYTEQVGAALWNQAKQVYDINTPTLQFEQQWIAEFWSDDALTLTFSPPSRWIAIADQVVDKEDTDLALALYTFLKVGLALNDAGVACWHSKYFYNIERPVSYIRRVIDPNWKPHNPFTPSFPAYPSGHATFGAAASAVLTEIYGPGYSMTDRCHEGRTDFLGMPRRFNSFNEMAEENAYSRVPLGVHFLMDATEGVRHGYAIGAKVNQIRIRK
jgi:membrane-associated phospholipid phosphatase